jgi:hypothetical protein
MIAWVDRGVSNTDRFQAFVAQRPQGAGDSGLVLHLDQPHSPDICRASARRTAQPHAPNGAPVTGSATWNVTTMLPPGIDLALRMVTAAR